MSNRSLEPDRILVNFLREKITDINSSRSTAFIFDDFPRIKDLGDDDFPRIGITILSEDGQPQGIFDDNQWETITFQIDIFCKKGDAYTITSTDESLGAISSGVNSDRLHFDNISNIVTNIKHNTTAFGTVTAKTTDTDFTTPASLSANIVEWSKSTGNLNFSAADVTSYNGQAITSTYSFYLEGKKQAQYLAREIIKAIKNYWRTTDSFKGLYYPVKISSSPVPFEDDTYVFRHRLEYQFNGYNFGED